MRDIYLAHTACVLLRVTTLPGDGMGHGDSSRHYQQRKDHLRARRGWRGLQVRPLPAQTAPNGAQMVPKVVRTKRVVDNTGIFRLQQLQSPYVDTWGFSHCIQVRSPYVLLQIVFKVKFTTKKQKNAS